MAQLPLSLAYVSSKLEGYETNSVRAFPDGDMQVYTDGQILRFTLPQTIVDLDSLFVSFEAGVSESVPSGKTARLPEDIHTLIERITIRIGSLIVDDGAHDWSLFKKKYEKLVGKRVGGNSHPCIVRTQLDKTLTSWNNTIQPGKQNETISVQGDGAGYVWDNFCKTFLATCEPRIVDLSIMPPVQIEFHLARDVCSANKDCTNAAIIENFATNTDLVQDFKVPFELRDPCIYVNCVSFASTLYDDMISATMGSGSIIIPFTKLYSFTDAFFTNNTNFNVATKSLDRIHWQLYQTNYTDVPFYKGDARAVVRSWDNNLRTEEINLGTDQSPRSVYFSAFQNANGEYYTEDKYTDPRFVSTFTGNLSPAASVRDVQFQVALNNTYHPQYLANVDEMYELTKDAVSEYMTPGYSQNISEWMRQDNHNVIRFNRPGSSPRNPSGLNTNNTAAHMQIMADSIPTECTLNAWAETTACIYVYPGKSVALEN